MFLELNRKTESSIAAVDDSDGRITYGELLNYADVFFSRIRRRTLVFILSKNCIGSMAGYVACLINRIVPLLIEHDIDRDLLKNLISTYKPGYLWLPEERSSEFGFSEVHQSFGFSLLKTELRTPDLCDDLSLLLTTSGSTGSAKLVRHSYSNLEASARSVSSFFKLDENERAFILLPIEYTMGLSILNSHLFAGGTALLSASPMTSRNFWDFLKKQEPSSITGVPYTYQILKRLRFFNIEHPYLKTISQGGGKLDDRLFMELAQYADSSGKEFIATYGQTEGTARMSYLPPEMATKKIGSIGHAIPSGHLSLVGQDGSVVEDMEATGELVYRGPNVTLGYSESAADLAKGDERNGILYTGDIARRDSEGYYYIVGRNGRFLKLYGLRVCLDESERLIREAFHVDCACTGNDQKMTIFIDEAVKKDEVHKYIAEKTGIFSKAFEVRVIDQLPRNQAGKVIYKDLQKA